MTLNRNLLSCMQKCLHEKFNPDHGDSTVVAYIDKGDIGYNLIMFNKDYVCYRQIITNSYINESTKDIGKCMLMDTVNIIIENISLYNNIDFIIIELESQNDNAINLTVRYKSKTSDKYIFTSNAKIGVDKEESIGRTPIITNQNTELDHIVEGHKVRNGENTWQIKYVKNLNSEDGKNCIIFPISVDSVLPPFSATFNSKNALIYTKDCNIIAKDLIGYMNFGLIKVSF